MGGLRQRPPTLGHTQPHRYDIPLYPKYDESKQVDLTSKGGPVGVTFAGEAIFSPFVGPEVGAATDYTMSAPFLEGDTFDQCGGASTSSDSARSWLGWGGVGWGEVGEGRRTVR